MGGLVGMDLTREGMPAAVGSTNVEERQPDARREGRVEPNKMMDGDGNRDGTLEEERTRMNGGDLGDLLLLLLDLGRVVGSFLARARWRPWNS